MKTKKLTVFGSEFRIPVEDNSDSWYTQVVEWFNVGFNVGSDDLLIQEAINKMVREKYRNKTIDKLLKE